MNGPVPDIVIDQRIRNNLIQYFELASSEHNLLEYQRNVPIAQALVELVEQLEDSFDFEHVKDGWYKAPTYTQEEIDAVLNFKEIWEMLIGMPEYVDSIGNFLSSNYWPPFQKGAERTLKVFMKRGYLSADEPEFNK
jgi:hypothetical protein